MKPKLSARERIAKYLYELVTPIPRTPWRNLQRQERNSWLGRSDKILRIARHLPMVAETDYIPYKPVDAEAIMRSFQHPQRMQEL